ncbi:MAG TPA: hypothetical protein VFI61_00150, partial [Patescibacteria group bacterium]|nr:hypothetical protein [Patescibacteria group bacterium]
ADYASIVKNGTALSDVLNLTLNENYITGSNYATLVLNRLGGDDNARALLVNSGNAQFNGQLQLGRFDVNPLSIGQGSLVFNTSDNLVYFWDGTAWVPTGSGGSTSFTNLTSGTNTTATMVVGSGASLTFTGTGTINASSLTCADCLNFTEFADAMTLDASTDIATAGFTLSTSGTGALNFASTGQVTFAGNVDAANGLDVTNANLTVATDTLLNGNVTLGDAVTDNITFTGRVAQDSDLIPITTTGTNDLGSLALPWDNIYGNALFQGGNAVCDSSGANCPVSSSNLYWGQALGALFPLNSTVDVLIGSSATTSAKFAFMNVNSGTPTASISGSIANVATYLTGDGLLATTNSAPLTIGDDTQAININSSDWDITSVGNMTGIGTISSDGDWTNTQGSPSIFLVDSTGGEDDYSINVQTNAFNITNSTDSRVEIRFDGTGGIDLGNNTATKTINIGGVTSSAADTINIATDGTAADVITIGNSNAATTLQLTGGTAWSISTAGLITTADDAAINGGDITTTATTFNLLAGATTTLNIGPGGDVGTITLSGGSGATGCTLDGTNGNFTCSGSISSTATTGFQGWWQRNLGVLSPTNITDDLAIGGIATASAKFQVDSSTGNITSSGDLALNGGDVTSTSTTFNFLNGTVTTLNIADSTTTKTINIGGVTASGTDTINIATNATAADTIAIGNNNASTLLDLTGGDDWSMTNTGILTMSASAAQTTAIVVTDTDYTNALSIGDNNIIGTTANIDLTNFDVVGSTGNVTTAGDVAINGGDLTSTATTFNFDIGNTGTLNFRDGTNTLVAISDQGTTGRLAVSDSLQVAGLTTVAYSRFGTASATHTGNITVASDVLISGDLELDGVLYLDGETITDLGGVSTITFAGDPTAINSYNTLTNGSWLIDNPTTGSPGIAALMVNQARDGPIMAASASGTNRFLIANNGTVTLTTTNATTVASLIVDGGLGKIDVGTVDPPYTINGKKFATFLSGIVGVKEEVVGQATTNEYVPGVGYRYLIDFNSLPEGSDLWLFGKTTDIKTNINKLVALLTPGDPTRVWYEVDKVNKRLAIYSARPTTISYRLTGPRFDHQNWGNARDEESDVVGFVLNNIDAINNSPIVINIQNMSDFVVSKVQDGYYTLKDNNGNIVDGVESIGNFVAGNVKSGFIETQELATNSFNSFQATIDNLLVTTGLVTPRIQTALISPLPNTTDVVVKLGMDATDSGKLAIQNNNGQEVASVDTQGNANFNGTVHSQNIDEIQAILNSVATDQTLLSQLVNSSISSASDSADLTQLATNDLYVTNQAAINSLSVTHSIAVGFDLAINSADNSINTITSPLKIQSLALAPLEIMNGKVRIDTNGDVAIEGNLYVAGNVKSNSYQLTANDDIGNPLASIDASGSALFNTLSTSGLTIAGASQASDSAVISGDITTNATAGKAIIPAYTTEITIHNPKITDYTLVYVTPTSTTQNNVLYVKSKGSGFFTIGFSDTIPIDVSLNWWVVETSQ